MPSFRLPHRHFSRRDFLHGALAGLLTSSVGYLSPRASTWQSAAQRSADVLVIGAGAAGLSAARHLSVAGWQTIVLEARERLGGRMWTDYSLARHPVELGAEFIHGSRVATWDWLEQAGLKALEDSEGEFYVYLNGLMQPAQPHVLGLVDALDEALEAWDSERDEPISAALSALDLSDEEARLLNSLFAPDNAADLDQMGMWGYGEATYEGDGAEDGDWRVAEGYSRLIEFMGAGLDVRLNSIVQNISWDETGVEVILRDGTMYEASQLIITLPLGVLQSGQITFDPPLPSAKREAIQALGAGAVNKLILKFESPFWADDLSVLATPLDSQFWWRPGIGRADEAPILTALIGGRSGARYSQQTQAEAIERGLSDLERMFGGLPTLAEGRFVNWGADPFSLMGYSYTPPGTEGLRAVLAQAVEGVLFFAGEATHTTRPSTVHGALESGLRAAREAMDV